MAIQKKAKVVEATPAAQDLEEAVAQTGAETTTIQLVHGRRFHHKGTVFLPGVAYVVSLALADALLSVAYSEDATVFESVGHKEKSFPRVEVTERTSTTSAAAPVAVLEIGGDLDSELVAHLSAGQQSGTPSTPATGGEGTDDEGTGEGDDNVVV